MKMRDAAGSFGFVLALASTVLGAREASAQVGTTGVDVFGELGPTNVGLLVVQGSARAKQWVDAEAMLWGGVGEQDEIDALIVSLRIREPGGRAELKAGRFILATGAVRPVHMDGGLITLRAPSRTKFEVFGGIPVVPDFGERDFDWLVGGRVSQGISNRATLGISYFHRRDHGARSDEEVGADLAFMPTDWLDMGFKMAYEIINPGLANLQASIAARTKNRKIRAELFVINRSPSRLLPATSLFTVLGDFASTAAGANVRWRAAPRLDIWTTMSLHHVDDFGWTGELRGVLRLDDKGEGSLLGEIRRQDVSTAGWTGIRTAATIPLHRLVVIMPELELVIPDQPDARGSVWPWGRVALRYRPSEHWAFAAAGEASTSPSSRYQVRALARVTYRAVVR